MPKECQEIRSPKYSEVIGGTSWWFLDRIQWATELPFYLPLAQQALLLIYSLASCCHPAKILPIVKISILNGLRFVLNTKYTRCRWAIGNRFNNSSLPRKEGIAPRTRPSEIAQLELSFRVEAPHKP